MYDITPSATPEMTAAVGRLEDGLRSLGLHVERHFFYSDTPPDVALDADADGDLIEADAAGPKLLVVDCLLGDLAFSKRVQDPQAAADDHAFKIMMADGMGNPEFDAARDELRQRIAEGKPLFGDD